MKYVHVRMLLGLCNTYVHDPLD